MFQIAKLLLYLLCLFLQSSLKQVTSQETQTFPAHVSSDDQFNTFSLRKLFHRYCTYRAVHDQNISSKYSKSFYENPVFSWTADIYIPYNKLILSVFLLLFLVFFMSLLVIILILCFTKLFVTVTAFIEQLRVKNISTHKFSDHFYEQFFSWTEVFYIPITELHSFIPYCCFSS